MGRLTRLKNWFGPLFTQIASVIIGLAFLWYGTSQPSMSGLALMFVGLIGVVHAVATPRSSLRRAGAPITLTFEMRNPIRSGR